MNNAEKLLERMKRSSGDFSALDFDTLYSGFGFTKREGGSHTVYSHPAFPQLRATVARHKHLPTGYAKTAVKLINDLHKLEAEDHLTPEQEN